MIIINDFFVRHKEAVSNQMEIILKNNKGKIISATRFMGQKPLQEEDIKDNIYVYKPIIYFFMVIKEIISNPKDIVHIFEEEVCVWKRILLNLSANPVFVSMYRKPDKKYANHLQKYKNLRMVFVELEEHKKLLIEYGISEDKIKVSPTPAKIKREKSKKQFNPDNVNILFASWNNKEGNAIYDRGLEYLLQVLKENTNCSLTIPLRDNDTEEFEKMARKLKVWNRIKLLEIHNNQEVLTKLFFEADFVAFLPQKRIVKDVPNSLIDGLVRGKPVVLTNIIDFSNIVKKEKIGYVIDVGETARKVRISIVEYNAMSERAYKYSIIHSPENYANIISNCYNDIKTI